MYKIELEGLNNILKNLSYNLEIVKKDIKDFEDFLKSILNKTTLTYQTLIQENLCILIKTRKIKIVKPIPAKINYKPIDLKSIDYPDSITPIRYNLYGLSLCVSSLTINLIVNKLYPRYDVLTDLFFIGITVKNYQKLLCYIKEDLEQKIEQTNNEINELKEKRKKGLV